MNASVKRWRWNQFSLRVMLFLFAAFGAALALVVVPSEQRRATVAKINRMGGKVEFEEKWREILTDEGYIEDFVKEESAFQRILRPHLPQEYLDHVVSIQLLNTDEFGDDDLAEIEAFTQLESLDLACTAVTDEGLVYLHKLHKLSFLNLWGTEVSDEGVADLRRRLPNCKIHGN